MSEYDASFIQWPLEFHILSYMNTNKLKSLSLLNIENIINDVYENNILLKSLNTDFVSSFKIKGINYYTKFINQDYDLICIELLKYKHTWDNYALSLVFLKILIYLHGCLNYQNKFIINFIKLLVCNLNFNPEERLSLSESTNKFESILDNLDIIEFNNLINNLMLS